MTEKNFCGFPAGETTKWARRQTPTTKGCFRFFPAGSPPVLTRGAMGIKNSEEVDVDPVITVWNGATFDNDTGVIDWTTDGNKRLNLALPGATVAYPDGTKDIIIIYILTDSSSDSPQVNVKDTGDTWNDPPKATEAGLNKYPTLKVDEVGALSLPEGAYTNESKNITFQNNESKTFLLKILDIIMR